MGGGGFPGASSAPLPPGASTVAPGGISQTFTDSGGADPMRRPFDPASLDELARRVIDALPAGVEQIERDVRSTVRAVLGAALERMDLVSREEFDVQQAVLARTRAKLESLERTVAELEARLDPPKSD